MFISTPWGVGLSPDSVSYAAAAKALAERADFMGLPNHWPPFFPMLLATVDLFTGEISLAGRILQACLFLCNTLLVAGLLKKTRQPKALQILVLLLTVFQPSWIYVHLYLWSEPLFLSFVLLNMWLLERTIRSNFTTTNLFLIAATAGAAILTRYAGLFLVIVDMMALAMWAGSTPNYQRWLNSVKVGMVSLLPLGIWGGFNAFRGDGVTNRGLSIHLPGKDHFLSAQKTFAGWLNLPTELGFIIALSLIALSVWTVIRPRNDNYCKLWALYILVYIVFILTSISLIDFFTPLDIRILFPLLPAAIILICSLYPLAGDKRWALIPLLLVLIGLISNISSSLQLLRESRLRGMGFASRDYQQMPIMSFISKFPHQWRFSTNGTEFFQLYLPQKADMFPRKLDPVSRHSNPNWPATMDKLAGEVDVLVYFVSMRYRYYLPNEKEINQLADFKLIYAQRDGVVWVNKTKVDFSTGKIIP